MTHLCEVCNTPTRANNRFCKDCKREKLAEMRAAGYLETRGIGGHLGQHRTADHRENVYETTHGVD